MAELLSYSVSSAIFLAALYLPYRLLLSRLKQPALNRATLLLIYALAIVVPFIAPIVAQLAAADEPQGLIVAGLPQVAAVVAPDGESVGEAIAAVAVAVYTAGVIFGLLITLISLVRVAAIMRRTKRVAVGDTTVNLLDSDGISPFSFCGRIVMQESDLDENAPMIIAHESSHIRRRHWADLIPAHAVLILQWFNPAAWLMLSELRKVHEYQADDDTVAAGFSPRDYQMMLLSRITRPQISFLTNNLYNSNLKNRIIMMNSKSSGTLRRLRPLLLLAALAAALCITSMPAVSSTLSSLSSASLSSSAQAEVTPQRNKKAAEEKVYQVVEVNPQYPGGDAALMKRMAEVVVYPASAMAEGKQGRVVVQFVVTKTGEVTSPKILHSVSPELDQAAIDAVMKLDRFTPGTMNGKPVNVSYVLPVQFKLTGDEDTKVKAADANAPGETAAIGEADIMIDGKLADRAALFSLTPDRVASVTIVKNDPAHPAGLIKVTTKSE